MPYRPLIVAVAAIAIAFGPIDSSAQVQSGARADELPIEQYIRRTWQIEDGLPQNTVSSIIQTRDGYIWFGTEEGLVRFNGTDFRIFDAGNTPAFETNQSVRALTEDMHGCLWIGTDGAGLVLYMEGGFHQPGNNIDGAQVSDLASDLEGNVWVATAREGLSRYSRDHRLHTVELPDSTLVLDIAANSSGLVFAGTNRGLFRVDSDLSVFPWGPRNLQDQTVQSVYVDRSDQVWASTRDGAYRVESNSLVSVHRSVPTLAFLEDVDGNLWLGLDGEGLLRLSFETKESLTTANGLPHDRVVALHQDNEQNIWIGTEGGGLVQLSHSHFQTYGVPEGLASEMIMTVADGRNGEVWVGTEGAGLYSLQNGVAKHYTTENGLKDNIITSVATSRDGAVWVGSYFGGLSKLQHGSFTHYGPEQGLPEGAVVALLFGRDGTLWIGTDGGLTRMRGDELKTYDSRSGLGSNYLTNIYEDHGGMLWIGTYDAGLYSMWNGVISKVENQPASNILSIGEDQDNILWISTLHDGIFVRRNGNWKQFARRHGLPSNSIYNVLFDDADQMWMSSNKGLFVADRRDVLNAVDEDSTAGVRVFGTADGLRSVEFNGGVQPAGVRASNGNLWFPSIRGAVVVDPFSQDEDIVSPPVVIESIFVNGDPANRFTTPGVPLELSPGEAKVEFGVTALTYQSRNNVSIEYRLEGQDENWDTTLPGRTITYTNLAPGEYTLSIRSVTAGQDGPIRGDVEHLAVVLRPYFFQRPGYWVLMFLLVTTLAILAHRLRVRRVTKRERERQAALEKVVDERTAELKRLNEHLEEEVQAQVSTLMSERTRYEAELVDARDRARESEALKSTILTNLGHEFRTPITSIIGFSDIIHEELAGESREFVTYIRDSARRLLDTVTAIIDMSELEIKAIRPQTVPVLFNPIVTEVAAGFRDLAESRGLALTVDVPDEQIVAHIDPQLVQKVVAVLMNNAFKFTQDGSICVRLRRRENDIEIAVADSGIGISDAFQREMFGAFRQESAGEARDYQGCGLGLTVAKRLVSIMGGTIDVESELGIGSTFTVLLPPGHKSDPAQDESSGLADRGPVARTKNATQSSPDRRSHE